MSESGVETSGTSLIPLLFSYAISGVTGEDLQPCQISGLK